MSLLYLCLDFYNIGGRDKLNFDGKEKSLSFDESKSECFKLHAKAELAVFPLEDDVNYLEEYLKVARGMFGDEIILTSILL